MTITMTTKNQVTLPKKIVNALHLEKGSMFDIQVISNKIQLTPVEVIEKVFTDEEYAKLDDLVQSQKGLAKKITSDFIDNLK